MSSFVKADPWTYQRAPGLASGGIPGQDWAEAVRPQRMIPAMHAIFFICLVMELIDTKIGNFSQPPNGR